MSLVVRVGHIGLKPRDGLDITRSARSCFGPSEKLLWPEIRLRKEESSMPRLARLKRQSERWKAYEAAYFEEMRELYRSNREPWNELLARPSVTLLCFCQESMLCHRTSLAKILDKLGAKVIPPHLCHARACSVQVPPERLMCLQHWRMVPPSVQGRVWQTYRPGQCDDKRPSESWHQAADEAIRLVWEREAVSV